MMLSEKGEVNMKTSFAFLLLLLALTSAKPEKRETNEHLLYPYGEAAGDRKNPKEDDGTSPGVPISEDFTFYGKTYNKIYVNNNGVVSFSVPIPEYTPKAIPVGNGKAFVAPYWADTNNMLGGEIFYRQTQEPELLRTATRDINEYFPEIPFIATWVFIATWDHVAYFGSLSRKVNTFQAVLCTDGHLAFIMLNYADIQWTTGAASQGNPRTGLEGIPAQAGFDSGIDKNYYNIPSSRTPQIINITKTSNVGMPGRWVFRVDNFIVPGDPEELTPKNEVKVPQKQEEPDVSVNDNAEDFPEQGQGHLSHEDSQEVPEEQPLEDSDEDESDHCEWYVCQAKGGN